MAKNITLMGADYPDVPAVQLPQTGGGTATFYDIKVIDNLNSSSTNDALSANQGRIIKEKLADWQTPVSGQEVTFPTTFSPLGISFTLTQVSFVRVISTYSNARPVALGVKANENDYSQIQLFSYVDPAVVSAKATGLVASGFLKAGTYHVWGQAELSGKNNISVDVVTFK